MKDGSYPLKSQGRLQGVTVPNFVHSSSPLKREVFASLSQAELKTSGDNNQQTYPTWVPDWEQKFDSLELEKLFNF
jgi:hypothetical protein